MLAGGDGRRMGAPKATVALAGHPLIGYPLDALRAAGLARAVVAKASTKLPRLEPGIELWIEPDTPRHPLTGLIEALRRAAGRDVLALACDLPLVRAEDLAPLLALREDPASLSAEAQAPLPVTAPAPLLIAREEPAPAVVLRAGGRLQPLCGLYRTSALPLLERAPAGAALSEIVSGLGARVLDVTDPAPYLNVNTPADLARAVVLLGEH